MEKIHRSVRIIGLILAGAGAALLGVNIALGGRLNIAPPLIFLVLGAGFFILLLYLRQRWEWAAFLYLPGFLMLAFGFIFLLNVLTNDWGAWAYAWLLLVAALGIGLLFANRARVWHPLLILIGWGMIILGFTFFGVFGVIAGGLFIQVSAPVLLAAFGISLRWLRLETVLPDVVLSRLRAHPRAASTPAEPLAEPLSSRELEVLRLIDAGLTNQQIAGRLSVAPSTVKTHINNLYGKLGVQTRVQALNRARELHLF